MFRKRRAPDRRFPPAVFDDASACTGELMFVTVMDGWLSMDCVLDFGEHGHIPAMVAAELAENPALAVLERDLIARWVMDGKHIEATLTVGTAGARLTVSAEGTSVILPVRTADKRAFRG